MQCIVPTDIHVVWGLFPPLIAHVKWTSDPTVMCDGWSVKTICRGPFYRKTHFICVNKIIHLITLVMIKNTILKNVTLIKKYSTYLHMRNQREPVQKTEQQFLQKMKGNLHISYGKWFYNRSTTLSVLDWTLTDRVVPFIYICVFCLSQGQNRNSTDFLSISIWTFM